MTATRLLLALLLPFCAVSCRSAQRLVKAFPADPSPFLVHGQNLKKTDASKSPFLSDWKNTDAKLWEDMRKRPHIHIAPVSVEHLRPMTRTLSKIQVSEKSRQKNVRKLADHFRNETIQAFRKAPEDRSDDDEITNDDQHDMLPIPVEWIDLNRLRRATPGR